MRLPALVIFPKPGSARVKFTSSRSNARAAPRIESWRLVQTHHLQGSRSGSVATVTYHHQGRNRGSSATYAQLYQDGPQKTTSSLLRVGGDRADLPPRPSSSVTRPVDTGMTWRFPPSARPDDPLLRHPPACRRRPRGSRTSCHEAVHDADGGEHELARTVQLHWTTTNVMPPPSGGFRTSAIASNSRPDHRLVDQRDIVDGEGQLASFGWASAEWSPSQEQRSRSCQSRASASSWLQCGGLICPTSTLCWPPAHAAHTDERQCGEIHTRPLVTVRVSLVAGGHVPL